MGIGYVLVWLGQLGVLLLCNILTPEFLSENDIIGLGYSFAALFSHFLLSYKGLLNG